MFSVQEIDFHFYIMDESHLQLLNEIMVQLTAF